MTTEKKARVSFKSLQNEKVLRRVDAHTARYQDLVVAPGFNLRFEESAKLKAHVDKMFRYVDSGGILPDIEVRINDDGQIEIVDGHCRHKVYGRMYEKYGKDLHDKNGEYRIGITPFTGNDVDRTFKVMESAGASKGLEPLELAMGFKRLRGMGVTVARMAEKMEKTPQYIGQLLQLADANSDVHNMINAGSVSVLTAINAVRKHGENAGAILTEQLAKAQARGKKRVTAGTVGGRALPKKITMKAFDAIQDLAKSIDPETKARLLNREDRGEDGANMDFEVAVPAFVLQALLNIDADVVEETQRRAHREKIAVEKAAQLPVPLEPTEQ